MSGVGSGATCMGCERWDYDIAYGGFCYSCTESRTMWRDNLGANFIAAGLCGHLERSSSRGAARAAEVVGSPEYDPCEGCAAGQPSHQRHMVGAYIFECEKASAP